MTGAKFCCCAVHCGRVESRVTMRKAVLLIGGLALVAANVFGGNGEVRRSSRRIPGQYIVVLEAGVSTASLENSVRNLRGAKVRHKYEKGVKGLALEMSDADARDLARDSRVQFVEEDATIAAATSSWALDRIDQRQLPLDGSFSSGGRGAGVTIYVVDTGVSAGHVEFAGRVSAGFSSFADSLGSSDCNGHGTHVAGIAAGTAYGVAKSATVVPVRVLDCNGSGSISTVLAGLDWVLADQETSPRPAVANLSLGGDASSALDSQVARLAAAGIATVVAAGNGNQDACKTSPARVAAVITVGATAENDQRASFSNYGSCVDLFAPGTNIIGASFSSSTATSVSSGTSSSAPLVTGVLALWLEKYPEAKALSLSKTVITQATADVLTDVGNSSPNRLLFSDISVLEEVTTADEQLLADPSFELGEIFWTSDVCSVVNPAGCAGDNRDFFGGGDDMLGLAAPSHSGRSKAVIGGPAKTFHLTSESLTLPSVRRAELSVYLWVVTKNKKQTAQDILTIEIRDASGKLLETLGTYSNLDASPGYQKVSFDVTKYRGATIRISFTGVQNPGPPTYFLLDDAALNIWR